MPPPRRPVRAAGRQHRAEEPAAPPPPPPEEEWEDDDGLPTTLQQYQDLGQRAVQAGTRNYAYWQTIKRSLPNAPDTLTAAAVVPNVVRDADRIYKHETNKHAGAKDKPLQTQSEFWDLFAGFGPALLAYHLFGFDPAYMAAAQLVGAVASTEDRKKFNKEELHNYAENAIETAYKRQRNITLEVPEDSVNALRSVLRNNSKVEAFYTGGNKFRVIPKKKPRRGGM